MLGQMTAQMISLSKLEGKLVACGMQDHVAGRDGNFNWPISYQSYLVCIGRYAVGEVNGWHFLKPLKMFQGKHLGKVPSQAVVPSGWHTAAHNICRGK